TKMGVPSSAFKPAAVCAAAAGRKKNGWYDNASLIGHRKTSRNARLYKSAWPGPANCKSISLR
ncbi:hypothetical protein, partial [Chromobacterium subtsugae]|uniref:hypothetical protein n=1 Tax=Chromobacterium subtsugae TaxID=251747 RepID=UPI001F3D0217